MFLQGHTPCSCRSPAARFPPLTPHSRTTLPCSCGEGPGTHLFDATDSGMAASIAERRLMISQADPTVKMAALLREAGCRKCVTAVRGARNSALDDRKGPVQAPHLAIGIQAVQIGLVVVIVVVIIAERSSGEALVAPPAFAAAVVGGGGRRRAAAPPAPPRHHLPGNTHIAPLGSLDSVAIARQQRRRSHATWVMRW